MFSLFVYFLRETKAPSSYQNNYGFQRRYTCLGKIERKNEWKYSLILRGGIYHCILPKWSCAQFTNVCIRNYLCCSTSYFIFGRRGWVGFGGGFVLFISKTLGVIEDWSQENAQNRSRVGLPSARSRVGLTCTKPRVLTAPRKNMITQLTLRSVIYFHAKSNFLRQCVIDVKMTAFKTVLRVTRSIMPEFWVLQMK